MMTDPRGNAWYDSQGAENADKCAWTFGSALRDVPRRHAVEDPGELVERGVQRDSSGYDHSGCIDGN